MTPAEWRDGPPGTSVIDTPAVLEGDSGRLEGSAASAMEERLAKVLENCLSAGGRYGESGQFGYVTGTVDYALIMQNDQGQERVLIHGFSAYQGTEDQQPGDFICLVDQNGVDLWNWAPE